jgi:phenylacetate-CoA ligase
LTSVDPEVLEQMGEAAVLDAFHSAAAAVPAYRTLLRERGIDPRSVTDVAAFRSSAPLLDKTIFSRFPLDQLCRSGTLETIKNVIPSSGHSGTFAFNVETVDAVNAGTTMADVALEHCLRVSARRALLVNAYPMGLQVPSALPCANTGVNVDVALAVIRKFGPYFGQLIVVSQPLFAKKLIDDGVDQGVDWAAFRTTVVTGGEGFSESWRTHMSAQLGLADPDRPTDRLVASSMGVAELAVNLFHEVPETIAIVRRAYRDPALYRGLFGGASGPCPHLFVCYPMRSYVEEVPVEGSPVGELVISMAGAGNDLPLLRYRTGDLARVIPYRRLEDVLSKYAPDLPLPSLRLPLVAVFGRRGRFPVGGSAISAELLKEALFRDPEVARSVTGFCKARQMAGRLEIDAQLRPGVEITSGLEARLAGTMRAALPREAAVITRLYPFRDFPHDVSHERKPQYVSRQLGDAIL